MTPNASFQDSESGKGLRKHGIREQGRYYKGYKDGKGALMGSSLESAVAKILEFTGVSYEYRKTVRAGESDVTVDFATRRGFIQVVDQSSAVGEDDVKTIRKLREAFGGESVLVVGRSSLRHSPDALGVPLVFLASEGGENLRSQSLFLHDPSLSFDYSHILPPSEKCSVLHGHTSSVALEVFGRPVEGMIVDFGEVKKTVKKCIAKLDHKLFIARRYVKEDTGSSLRIGFKGANGEFNLAVPKSSVFVLEGEATVENLAEVLVKMIIPQMPRDVDALGVYVYEGLNKGAHILADLRRNRDNR